MDDLDSILDDALAGLRARRVCSISLLVSPCNRSVVSYGHVHAGRLLSRSFSPAPSPCALAHHPASPLNSSLGAAAAVHGRSFSAAGRARSCRRARCCIADARSPRANTRKVCTPSTAAIVLWLMLPACAAPSFPRTAPCSDSALQLCGAAHRRRRIRA